MRRFVVADRSMEPTLTAGQGLIGRATRTARVGELRCFEHPKRVDFWLVKRVASVVGSQMTVLSDNHEVGTADSRSFGIVPVDGSFRVIVRVPHRLM
ncbi:MAG: hypothetical protein ACJAXA_000825 [Candidatus Aldehydirespiratoraceae bacterium]|jgi:hypothetical protein